MTTSLHLISDSPHAQDIRSGIKAAAPREVAVAAVLYANVSVFVATLLGVDGMGMGAVIAYVFTVLAIQFGTAAGVILTGRSAPAPPLWIVGGSVILFDLTVAAALLFGGLSDEPAYPNSAVGWVALGAFLSLPFSTSLLTPFLIGKSAIFAAAIAFVLAMPDQEFGDAILIPPLILAWLMIVATGTWLFVTRTRERHLSVEAHHLRLAAEENARLRERLYNYIGHDLRQPISALGLLLFDLERSKAAPAHGDTISDARACVRSIHGMIEDLLDASRLRAEGVEPQLAPTAIGDVFTSLTEEFSRPIREAGGRLRVVPSRTVLLTDAYLLGRVLRNLLANTVRHAEGADVVMGLRRSANAASILVADNGPGMDTASPTDPRSLSGADRERSGFGLGLSIADELTRALGGELRVQSRPGWGVVCRVTLPLLPHPEG